ncbi:YegP family protein [Salinilacihabitans rarus]|uniref:DUF1508 domain-containing protein n=1 Tax=Salinilacihabitans rarus TaxID=2961596 RepID=UPI0020C83A28|nr:YegP family protein [Salinilacihabitans rarus]
MSPVKDFHQKLFRLYEHYVGEPESPKDVYGYWLFVFGFLGAAMAVVLYAGTYALIGSENLQINRVAGVLGGLGLSLLLFGIVMMLPVRRRGLQAAAVGFLVSLVGVGSFGVFYPSNIRVKEWGGTGPDWTIEVIASYAVGIGLIAVVTALIPVVTGRKGMFVEEEGASDDPDILTGDALEGAQYAVFRDEKGDWKWHVLHLEALAASEDSAVTRPEAEEAIDQVKSQIGSAGLMELTTSAFRLYEDRAGNWQWTLARDDGSIVGACAREFEQRDGAEESVSFFKDRAPEADVIEIEGAAFTYVERRDRWYWQLLDDDRTPLAESETGFADQNEAEEAAHEFAKRFDQARLLDVDHIGVELRQRDDGGWIWRFVDEEDREIAESAAEFSSRRDAEEAVEDLLPELESASITVAGEPTYELYEDGDEWQWRLVDENEHLVARGPDAAAEHAAAEHQTRQFGEHARGADVVEIDDAEYEIYPVDADEVEEVAEDADEEEEPPESNVRWNWRLVTEDREIIAASDEAHFTADAAETAIDRVREQAREADLIEFEHAAFQVYEADDGEWRWRLIDEDGNVLADSGEEHTTRGEAAEAMMTLKEQAPDAELLEIDTAAFELFVNEDDEWGWRLIDAGGKLVAEDPTTHPTRGDAKDAMDRLIDNLESEVREMENAIFQTYADESWHWRFVLPSGETVAVDDKAHPTRDELLDTLPAIREAAATAREHTIGDVAVQVYRGGDWQFRLVDRDREMIADSSVGYDNRETAVSAARDLERHAADAPIFTIETAAIRLGGDDGWHWELVDADRDVLAGSVDAEPTKDEIVEDVDRVRKLAPMAGRVDFDVASFELFADEDDRWRWRLINEEGLTVAAGSEGYESTEAAREALDDLRDMIETASILEIDSVSFELHTGEDGWKWKLVDRYGVPMTESTRTYETRTEAREAMKAVKEHAPNGWITFTE